MNRFSFPSGQSQGFTGYQSQGFNGPQGPFRGPNHIPRKRHFNSSFNNDMAELIADFKRRKEEEKAKSDRDLLKKELQETIDAGIAKVHANTTGPSTSPDPISSPHDNLLTQILFRLDSINNKVAAQENTIASVLALQSRPSPPTVPTFPSSSVPASGPSIVPTSTAITIPVLVLPSTGITEEFVHQTSTQVMTTPSPLPDKIQILWFRHMAHLKTLVARKNPTALKSILKELHLPVPANLNHDLFREIMAVYRLAHSIDVYADLK